MRKPANAKKRLIISSENLSEELKELFKEVYSEGYGEYMQKIVKPDGTPIFVVPLETEEISYMVKFEVMIDSKVSDEDLDKGLDLSKEEDASADIDEIEEEKDDSHKEFALKHGDYDQDEDDDEDDDEDEEEEEPKKKKAAPKSKKK